MVGHTAETHTCLLLMRTAICAAAHFNFSGMLLEHPAVGIPQQRSRSQTLAVGTRPPFAGSVRRKSRRVRPKEQPKPAPRKEFQHLAMLGFDPETGLFDVSVCVCI